jgi:dinuclear metal center YbgI/SA1388 family protein
MLNIQKVIQYLERFAPTHYQESYDNAGLLVGNPQTEVQGVLVSLDAIEAVVEEAIQKKCNLIVSHHPIIFKGLKKINGKNYVERTIIKAIQHNIALYAIHTNLDNVQKGVNYKIAETIGLEKVRILAPKTQTLMKLTFFVPIENTKLVLEALWKAGAGQIGEYKNCSFQTEGVGSFQPSDNAQPYIGQAHQLEYVNEHRVEVMFPIHLQHQILQALFQAHPYQEVAYYLHLLENVHQEIGSGAIGELPQGMTEQDFMLHLKQKMNLKMIRHTRFLNKEIKTVALCGGAGSFLLSNAIRQKADVFVTADYKYHEFFDAEDKIVIADIGHYESEAFTQALLKDEIQKGFPDLEIQITEVDTNPVFYQ